MNDIECNVEGAGCRVLCVECNVHFVLKLYIKLNVHFDLKVNLALKCILHQKFIPHYNCTLQKKSVFYTESVGTLHLKCTLMEQREGPAKQTSSTDPLNIPAKQIC